MGDPPPSPNWDPNKVIPPPPPPNYRSHSLQEGCAVLFGCVGPTGVCAVGQSIGHGWETPVLSPPVEESPGVKAGGRLGLCKGGEMGTKWGPSHAHT